MKFFSDTVAETLLRVLNFHVEKKLGKNLVDGKIEKPAETYKAIYSFFGTVGTIRALEMAITRQIKRKYKVQVDNRLISRLRVGNNEALLNTVLKRI